LTQRRHLWGGDFAMHPSPPAHAKALSAQRHALTSFLYLLILEPNLAKERWWPSRLKERGRRKLVAGYRERRAYREVWANGPRFVSKCGNLDLLRRASWILNLINKIKIVLGLWRFWIGAIDRTLGNAHRPIIGNHGGLLFDVVIIEIV
jgi:hypothetical protein